MTNPIIVGHRGARNLWAENSLTGFRNLLGLKVESVEFDVHLSAAGELLVIHDATLDRTTERSGRVADLAAGEYRSVILKGTDERIPTLEEVLEIYAPTGLELHVELKAGAEGKPYEGLEARAAAEIDRFGLAGKSFLTSFNSEVLKVIGQVAPHIRRLSSLNHKSVEARGLRQSVEAMLQVSDVLAIEKALLREEWELLTALIPAEKLGVWVPNELEDLSFWLKQPLRQITTDRPDLGVKAREGLFDAAH
ncbi:glycerophosphodiester phosphodiesterase family protein [Neorhizobium sp. CSC1952]|uniref:glycerophosphodiester phosphodiesterase family protein n=1 Tax=Neorhizobium sp. CSC1952 TaxID=2978974 RepID=UPI0025A62A5E|nr:glycerophosphodiester phosphodiesterase family protein [Rhizobium sp. CSC1952]WJR68685.1 glycerophosphodiester phosphodiesterase family protein [Rhizobium sp. CSC1952]